MIPTKLDLVYQNYVDNSIAVGQKLSESDFCLLSVFLFPFLTRDHTSYITVPKIITPNRIRDTRKE